MLFWWRIILEIKLFWRLNKVSLNAVEKCSLEGVLIKVGYNLEIFFEIKPICRRIIKFIFWYRKQHSPHLNCLFIYPFNLHMRSTCYFIFGVSSPEMKDHQLLFSNLNLFFTIGKCAFQWVLLSTNKFLVDWLVWF